MPSMTTSKVSRWDQHGREHIVHVQRAGMQRSLTCDTCGWRQRAQFLPWLKAEEHLAEAHQATVDPTETKESREQGTPRPQGTREPRASRDLRASRDPRTKNP